MPRIFGTNVFIILLAAFLFFMLGWVWYGMLFNEAWMTLSGITAEMAEENPGQTMLFGFLIALLQALGLAGIMSMISEDGVLKGLKVGAMAWLFFALPVTAYEWNYGDAPLKLIEIDAGYILVGYMLMGAVYGLLRKAG